MRAITDHATQVRMLCASMHAATHPLSICRPHRLLSSLHFYLVRCGERGPRRHARASSRHATCSELQERPERRRRAPHGLDGRGLSMWQQSGLSRVAARARPSCCEDLGLACVSGVARGAIALVAVADAAIRAIVWTRLHRAICPCPWGDALARTIDTISPIVTIVRA